MNIQLILENNSDLSERRIKDFETFLLELKKREPNEIELVQKIQDKDFVRSLFKNKQNNTSIMSLSTYKNHKYFLLRVAKFYNVKNVPIPKIEEINASATESSYFRSLDEILSVFDDLTIKKPFEENFYYPRSLETTKALVILCWYGVMVNEIENVTIDNLREEDGEYYLSFQDIKEKITGYQYSILKGCAVADSITRRDGSVLPYQVESRYIIKGKDGGKTTCELIRNRFASMKRNTGIELDARTLRKNRLFVYIKSYSGSASGLYEIIEEKMKCTRPISRIYAKDYKNWLNTFYPAE